MKKAFLFRLFAIAFFCLASLAIRSETSFCKIKCDPLAKNRVFAQPLIATEQQAMPPYSYEGFFIKI